MKKMKKLLIPVGIILAILLIVIIAPIIYVANEKVVYGKNYYNDDGSIHFSLNNDGTCETKNAVSCNYEIKGNTLNWKAVWNYYGTEFTYIVDFEIINKNELKSEVATVNGVEASFKSSWIAGRKEFKTTTTEALKPYYKTYTLLTLNSGKKATITFNKNGKCDVDFSQFNNSDLGYGHSGTSRSYTSVTYNTGVCNYKVIDDKSIIVNYTGIVEIKYHWYMDYYKRMQTTLMGSQYVLKDAAITFEEDYNKFKFTNGKFVGQSGEVFYYYYKLNDSEKENEKTTTKVEKEPEENNHTTTIKKEDKTKQTTTTTSKGEITKTTKVTEKITTTVPITEEKIKNVDTISVSLRKRQDIYYCVYLSSDGDYYQRNDDYKILINGESFDANPDFPAACYKYTKEGKHCLDITVVDSDNNKKEFKNKCIDFTPDKLNYSATVSEGYGGYYIRMYDNSETSRNNNNHYNNSNNITVYLDGKKVSSTFYVGVSFTSCNHTIKLENKFGKTQTINLTC